CSLQSPTVNVTGTRAGLIPLHLSITIDPDRVLYGQTDCERAAFSEPALHIDIPPVSLNNTVGSHQPRSHLHSRAPLGKGEVKDLPQSLGSDSPAVVGDLNVGEAVFRESLDLDGARAFNSLCRILQQAHENLVQLSWETEHLGDLVEFFDHPDSIFQLAL